MTIVSAFGGDALQAQQRADGPEEEHRAGDAPHGADAAEDRDPGEQRAAITSSSRPTAPSGRALAKRIV